MNRRQAVVDAFRTGDERRFLRELELYEEQIRRNGLRILGPTPDHLRDYTDFPEGGER